MKNDLIYAWEVIEEIIREIEYLTNKENGYYAINEIEDDDDYIEFEPFNYSLDQEKGNLLFKSKDHHTYLAGFRTPDNKFIYFSLYEDNKCYRQSRNSKEIEVSEELFGKKFNEFFPELVKEWKEYYDNNYDEEGVYK